MYGYIYKRQNKINGMIYIGQHKYDKMMIDESYRGSGHYFKNALNKYGENNFTYELIDFADTSEELNNKERYWIAHYDCITPNGYNIAIGGQLFINHDLASNIMKERRALTPEIWMGWKQSEHQKEVVREYMTNREITDDFRNNVSLGHINMSDEAKAIRDQKLRDYRTGMRFLHKGDKNLLVNPEDVEQLISEGYEEGMYVSDAMKDLYKALSEDYHYVTNEIETKNVRTEDLQAYLDAGWRLGRKKDDRGSSISASKKGKIKIMNDEGKIKYISESELDEYKKLGFDKWIIKRNSR